SKAVPQRMTQRSAWLQFLQEFKTEQSSRSSDNPICCRSQLGLLYNKIEAAAQVRRISSHPTEQDEKSP
ncbi:hypothetical protein, partial [Candidatus Electronema sp. TJ]|uniref:hypothetical protein n=1 Tax=Candidatus Electronema sp. TJ TaxID=3401573 RepID=UPI003AA9007C